MKKTIRIFGILLVAAMLLSTFALTASAAETEPVVTAYDGTAVTPQKISSSNYAHYGFTADNWSAYDGYYAITSAAELYGWASVKGNAVLINDIVVNTGDMVAAGDAGTAPTYTWTPVENFSGTFDGRGHSISGLYVSASHAGFFKSIKADSTVKNLTITNSYFYGSSKAGGIVYNAASGSFVENCLLTASVKVKAPDFVSGVACYADGVSLTNCVFLGKVHATDNAGRYVGAIVGSYDFDGTSKANCTGCYYISGNATDAGGNVFKALTYNRDSRDIAGQAEGISSTSATHTCISLAHPAVTSACYSNGSTAYSDCLICGKILSGSKSVTGRTHQWQDATCVSGKQCSVCNATEGTANPDNHSFDENGSCSGCSTQAEAKVNGQFYISVDDAITYAQANSGSEVVLLADELVINDLIKKGTFTLDLNGHSVKSGDNWIYFVYMESGHLTIKDSVGTGQILKNAKNSDIVAASGGSVTIYGGNFGDVYNYSANGTVTIYGGSYRSVYGQSYTYPIQIHSATIQLVHTNSGNIWGFLAPDSFYYDADGNLLDAREVLRAENVTVRQGADLTNAVLTLEYESITYTGVEQKPAVTVTVLGKTVSSEHYQVTYESNIYVGQATVTVTAAGDSYTGSVSGTFTIEKATPEQSDFVVDYPDYYYEVSYSGEAKTVTVTASVFSREGMGEITVKYYDADGYQVENPIDAGTYTVKIDVAEGDNYLAATDLELATFTITPAALSADSIDLSADSFIYNGAEQKPAVTITFNGVTLTEGTDYTLSWPEDLTNAGTKTVTISGKNYTGSFTYEIRKADPIVTATSPLSQVLSGNRIKLMATASYLELTEGLPTEFVITAATNATWDGMVITVNDNLIIGQDTVTITISSVETQNYNAASHTITLEVGMADYSAVIAELEAAIAQLQELADSKADASEIAAKLAEITNKIDAIEQNGATDAEVAEAIAAVKSEFALSIAALEDKIAEEVEKLQSQIDSNDTDIADIKAAIDEINALIEALKAADETLDGKITDAVNAAKSELAEAVSALEAKIAEEVEKLQSQIDSNDTDIADIKAAIEEINALIEALKAADETLDGKITDAVNAAKSELAEAVSALEAKIAEEVEKLQGQIDSNDTDIADIKAAIEEINALIEALKAADETLDGKITDAVNAAKSELAEAISALEAKIAEEVEKLQGQIDSNDTDIADIKAAIEEINALIKALKAADETLDGKITDAVNAAKSELAEAVSALEAKIAEEVEKLQGQIDSNDTDIADIKAAIEEINALIEALKAADETLDGKITDAIAKAEKELKAVEDALKALIGGVQSDLDSTKEKLDQAIEDLNKAIADGDNNLAEEIAALNAALAEAKAALEKADADNKAALVSKIDTAVAALEAAIQAVQQNLDDAKAELDKAIADGDAALSDRIDALNDALASAQAALEAADEANKSELMAKMEEADAALQAAINALAKELDSVKQALDQADADNQTFIIIVCVISCVAFCGCCTLAVIYFIDRKKKH